MVTGWSWRVGSSCVPTSAISCTSAFPLDVTRIVICVGLLVSISACGGSTANRPCQVPARVFNWVKDFSASDCAGLLTDFCASDFCASDWAKATVVSDIRTTGSIKRSDFMFHPPSELIFWGAKVMRWAYSFASDQLYRISAALLL